MMTSPMKRRDFVKSAGIGAAALGMADLPLSAKPAPQIVITCWRGFNLLEYFSLRSPRNQSEKTTEEPPVS